MTIETVAAAFDRLLALAAKNTDGQTCWTIAAVKDDVIDILAGTWHGDEADECPCCEGTGGFAPEFDDLSGATIVCRTCNGTGHLQCRRANDDAPAALQLDEAEPAF